VRQVSAQIHRLQALKESRPYLDRLPDQGILVSDAGEGGEHVRATRDLGGRCAMVYLPTSRMVAVRTGVMRGQRARAWWYDPRTDEATTIGLLEAPGVQALSAPVSGPDRVLVLEDADLSDEAPGTIRPPGVERGE
jgi:hypothetical protein